MDESHGLEDMETEEPLDPGQVKIMTETTSTSVMEVKNLKPSGIDKHEHEEAKCDEVRMNGDDDHEEGTSDDEAPLLDEENNGSLDSEDDHENYPEILAEEEDDGGLVDEQNMASTDEDNEAIADEDEDCGSLAHETEKGESILEGIHGEALAEESDGASNNEEEALANVEEKALANEENSEVLPNEDNSEVLTPADEEDDGTMADDMSELSYSGDGNYHLDYTCQLCGQDFPEVNSLFTHLETHDSAEYGLTVQNSPSALTCFGETVAAEERKWPSRFLRSNSPVLQRLAQSPSSQRSSPYENGADTGSLADESESEPEPSPPPPTLTRMPTLTPASDNIPSVQRYKTSTPLERSKYLCPYCSKPFVRSDHFRQHLLNHQGRADTFDCEICGAKFNVLVTLKRHMSTHEEFKAFKCSKCPRRFHDQALLKRHEDSPYTHTELESQVNSNSRRKCRTCIQTFGSEASRLEHERRVHGAIQPKVVLRCRYTACRELHPTLKLLIQHYKDKHGAERLLEAAKALQNHSQSQPPPPSPLLLPLAYKTNCEVKVNGINGSKEEIDLPVQPLNKSKRQSNSVTPTAGTEGSIECRMCFLFLSSIVERNHHEQSVHNINNHSTVLQCKYSKCRKTLGAKNWLARHIREHRDRINQGIEMESEEDLIEMSKFLGVEPLEEEEEEQMGEEPEPELAESSEGEADAEIEEPWDCRLCDQRFLEESDRAAHEDHLHDTGNFASEFVCKFCRKDVGNFPSLLIHFEKAHKKLVARTGTPAPAPPRLPPQKKVKPKPVTPKSDKNMIFPCRHCDLTFPDQHARVMHEYDLHDTKDALDNYYPCKVCTKVMTLRGLRKHIRKIHGENSYIETDGPQVDAMDTEPVNQREPTKALETLKQQEPAKEPETLKQPEPARQPEPVKKPDTTPSPKKTTVSVPPSSKLPTTSAGNRRTSESSKTTTTASWVCRLCFEEFDEQRQRETHEHSVHGTNSPNATYVCKYSNCELSFATFRALIKHLRNHGETTFPKGQQKLPTASLTQYKPHLNST